MASESQHKHIVRFTLEWITKLLRSSALRGPGRRASALEALGVQAILLHIANFSAFELTQPQLFGFRWSPPWFLIVGATAVVNRIRPGIARFATTTIAIVFDDTRVTSTCPRDPKGPHRPLPDGRRERAARRARIQRTMLGGAEENIADLQKKFRRAAREGLALVCGKGYEQIDEAENKTARLSARARHYCGSSSSLHV